MEEEPLQPPQFTSLQPEVNEALKVIKRFVTLVALQNKTPDSVVMSELMQLDMTIPLNANNKGIYPYYRQEHAKTVKKIIDTMLEEKKNSSLSAKEFGVSRYTLLAIINQGWMYLSERMDEADKYKLLRHKIEVCKITNGVKLCWKQNVSLSVSNPDYVGTLEDVDSAPPIKEELLNFLENGLDETKYVKTGLHLSVAQIDWIKDMCDGVPNVLILALSDTKVLIVRSSTAAKYRANKIAIQQE